MSFRSLYFPFFLFFFSVALHAQSDIQENWHYIEVDSTKQMWGDWNEPDWLRYFGLDAGDVDRDGNLDIISGRYVYHNPGGSMEGHWKRTVLDDNVDGILFMDVDGDPYADIIAMALPDLYWYEAINAEGTRYKRTKIGEVPATSHVNSQGFEKAQLIAGGKSEFVIAGNGDIYAVEIPEQIANDGTRNGGDVDSGRMSKADEQPDADAKAQSDIDSDSGGMPKASKASNATLWNVKMICKNTSDEGIGVGDIDGDGDLDIAAGRRPEGEDEPKILVWFENPGHIDELWKPTVVGESEHPIDRVGIADLDGDQKPDIVVTEERYPGEEPDANFWWFKQDALDNWKQNIIVTQYSINNLDITDFDEDGDADLLTAEHKGKALELQLWKNDGAGNFSKTVLDTGKENHLGTQFFDLDNDGDLDIIGAGWDNHKFMHVWRNDQIASLKTGMRFKAYPWNPSMTSDDGKFLRVGGKMGYAVNKDHLPKKYRKNGGILLNQNVDLKGATRAEVLVERVQSHEDTKDLRIQFNQGKKILLPEPPIIPDTATNYMFHSNIRVPVHLEDLKEGNQNTFQLTVAKDQSWDWPQNLVYGVVLRVFYETDEGQHPDVSISGIAPDDDMSGTVRLALDGPDISDIAKVDYIGLYEDINVQGDGKYRQWQYRYHRGALQDHLGSATEGPFEVTWNTDWIPDQNHPITITALATDVQGYIHVLPMIHGLHLKREHGVSLIKPYVQDPFWTTRNGEHSQLMDIPFKVSEKDLAKLYWNSWSPCYSEGLSINGTAQQKDADTPCYDEHWHEEPVAQIDALKQGKNELTTLKTPLHNGEMVHGMDVQWPGIMLKVKHYDKSRESVTIHEGRYEDRPHFVVHTPSVTYYYDKAGGGFSRLIDNYGNDWIQYRTEPWDQYPASAASAFRGLPNLVFGSDTDGGAGHPGHDKAVSEVTSWNTIRTKSKSGNWAWEWTFHDDHARLNVLKSEKNTPYWFLYEGTPGGSFEPGSSVYGTNATGLQKDIPDFYKGSIAYGNYDWAYFGAADAKTSLFVAQVEPDEHVDMMSYLGNSDKGAESADGMTVFAFGRGKDTQPLLTGQQSFIIGMAGFAVNDMNGHENMEQLIDNLTNQTENE